MADKVLDPHREDDTNCGHLPAEGEPSYPRSLERRGEARRAKVVTVRLNDVDGKIADTASRRIGLRKIEVIPPGEDVALHLRVNGVPVFAKGADWIPVDNMPTRVTPEILRWYMSKAAECNFNFIRFWGGGYCEEDELFELCDELGLMLQFELKFANASYPVQDESWMDNLREQIEQQTRRCRNHPSIVIWSGTTTKLHLRNSAIHLTICGLRRESGPLQQRHPNARISMPGIEPT
jgi:beta-galactosidase/beta-glucuronidase